MRTENRPRILSQDESLYSDWNKDQFSRSVIKDNTVNRSVLNLKNVRNF